MQIHQTDFSTGNVYRNIMEVAVPMIIAQILNLLYNIVDRIYIGRIPEIGATALTGVGLCFPIITLITALPIFLEMEEHRFAPWNGEEETGKKQKCSWETPL